MKLYAPVVELQDRETEENAQQIYEIRRTATEEGVSIDVDTDKVAANVKRYLPTFEHRAHDNGHEKSKEDPFYTLGMMARRASVHSIWVLFQLIFFLGFGAVVIGSLVSN